MSRVEEDETTRAVRVLGFTLGETLVADERGLLVTDHARDGNPVERSAFDVAVDFRRGDDAREDGRLEAKEAKERVVPLEGFDGHEECTRGVGDIDGMDAAVGCTCEVLRGHQRERGKVRRELT